jgi:hypothetical protein
VHGVAKTRSTPGKILSDKLGQNSFFWFVENLILRSMDRGMNQQKQSIRSFNIFDKLNAGNSKENNVFSQNIQ